MKFLLLIKTEIAGSQMGGRGDFWKVGKLNHKKVVGQSVGGPKFRNDATSLLEHDGCNYYIKEDLRKAG